MFWSYLIKISIEFCSNEQKRFVDDILVVFLVFDVDEDSDENRKTSFESVKISLMKIGRTHWLTFDLFRVSMIDREMILLRWRKRVRFLVCVIFNLQSPLVKRQSSMNKSWSNVWFDGTSIRFHVLKCRQKIFTSLISWFFH